ncbi:cytochrome b [Flavimaricola marinus]|uniref:Cytochrome b562 n=1 Tax=Flavimaricola marinus TaxID=1819565 RepID=A0A238LH52_9RHOB|nr:cytochrome b/b6 domain-containing protein [Flavimaricola marinus]SMY08734.1 Cytochrome b562 [Flavimaricola marinus]
MAQRTGYSTAQITLHWLTAIGVLVAFFTHDAMEEIAEQTWEAGGAAFPTVHTIAGMTVFFLVLVRVILRLRTGAPEPEGDGIQQAAAVWGHRLLYLMLLAVPLGGFLTWIVGIQDLGDLHGLAGKALMIVALGHAAMAIYHQFVKKDGTLMRMLRPGK